MKKIITLIFTSCYLLLLNVKVTSQCTLTLPAKVPLGANLLGLTDYSRDRVFNDVFKTSRPMSGDIFQPWNFVPINLDANGWPLQDFGVVVMTNMDSTMGGDYRIEFLGKATITPVASGFTVVSQAYSASLNKTKAILSFPAHISNGGQMMIAFTNTHYSSTIAGIKHIKIMKPGLTVAAPTFSSKLLNQLARFDCIRYMDWHETNNNPDSLWAKRTKKSYPSQQQTNGAAWEYIIEMANTLKKDLWINIPHKAGNSYILNLATLLRDSLKYNQQVYVEYSNELWNGSFGQTSWIHEKAIAEGNTPGSVINYDNVNDEYTWHMRYIAKRSKEISDIFRKVFGEASINNRIRVVLGQQFGFFDFTVRGVDFINDYYGKPYKYFYALAVAPYFNTSVIDGQNNNATATQILNSLQRSVTSIFPTYNNTTDMWAARAAFYGLKMVAYEAGPDTFGPNNIDAKIKANHSDRMRFICEDYLNKWYKYGFFALLNWYTAGAADYNTPYGTWPVTENFEYSQKLRAIDSVHNAPVPAFSVGQAITTPADARKYAGYSSSALSEFFFQPANGWPLFYEYLVRVAPTHSGLYTITFTCCANANNQTFTVQVDDSTGIVITPDNNNFSAFTNKTIHNIKLTEGLHTIRLTPTGGFNFRVRSILFNRTANCTQLQEDHLAGKSELISSTRIYPNPAKDNATILLSGNLASILLTDLSGHVLYRKEKVTEKYINLSLQDLAAGTYLIIINEKNQKQVLKLVKSE